MPQSPLLFFKAPTCLIPAGAAIPRPEGYERIDMEAELVAVIGRRASKVPASEAWNHVAGYALGNDVSNRDLQKADKQWTRAKGFDGFGPLGPFVRMVAPGTVLPVDELRIRGYLNDELRQDGPPVRDDLRSAHPHRAHQRVHDPRAGRSDLLGNAGRGLAADAR